MKMFGFLKKEDSPLLAYSYSGIIRFMPLIVSGGFFLCTILLFAFGPLQWEIANAGKLYVFLFACLFALVAGYLLAVYKGNARRKELNLNIELILLVGVAVFLVLYFPTVYYSTGKWYPDIYTGITNTGEAYRNAKYYADNAPKLVFYIKILLAPITAVISPIVLFFSSKLSKTSTVLGFLTIVLNVALGIAQGQNKQVADVVMQLVLVLFILMFTDNSKKTGWIHKLKMLGLILLICLLFFAYYSNAMRNRVSHDVQQGAGIEDSVSTDDADDALDDETLDNALSQNSLFSVGTEKTDSLWHKIVPAKIRPTFQYMISYFCHGYYGLSLAMEEDFTSSYGLGFSEFFRHNFSKFFGGESFEDAVFERTYMSKIESKGWSTGAVWSSFFVFPASDISFPGTVLLVFFIGFFFGLSWKDSISSTNPFALVVFFNFCTMVFYFSANNQIFQMGEPAVGFVVCFVLWMLTRWSKSDKAAAVK